MQSEVKCTGINFQSAVDDETWTLCTLNDFVGSRQTSGIFKCILPSYASFNPHIHHKSRSQQHNYTGNKKN